VTGRQRLSDNSLIGAAKSYLARTNQFSKPPHTAPA
jgi:hypothetical protein